MSASAKQRRGCRPRLVPAYDTSWVVPDGGFKLNATSHLWKQGTTPSCTWRCGPCAGLVRLGVLEKVEGPIRHDPEADKLQFGNIPGITFPEMTAEKPREKRPLPSHATD